MQTLQANTLESTFHDTDCILTTDAGIEALTSAYTVPDEDAPAPNNGGSEFTPDTAEKVDWVLGKIADARTRAARIRENAEAMARACERDAEALEWRFGAHLQAFARQELAGGKKKSIRLFHGVLGYRTKPAGISVTDPTAALAWARENLPEAVTESVDRRALSAALLDTGEAVPFADFHAAEDVFFIK